MGAKELLPGPLEAIARGLAGVVGRLPVPIPALAPTLPVQFIHEADVGQAFLLVHRRPPALPAPTTSPATAC